jgi:hypothetical protein
LQRLEVFPWLVEGDLSITLPLFLLVLALWFSLGRYYDRTFGKVEPVSNRGCFTAAAIVPLVVFIAIVVLENVLYRLNVGMPFSLIGVGMGLMFLYFSRKTLRWYHTAAGALLTFAGFLPGLLGVGLGDPIYGSIGVLFLILLGTVIFFSGLLDHLLLVRGFPIMKGGDRAGDA